MQIQQQQQQQQHLQQHPQPDPLMPARLRQAKEKSNHETKADERGWCCCFLRGSKKKPKFLI